MAPAVSWNRIVDLHIVLDNRRSNFPLIESRLSVQPLNSLEFIQSDHFRLRLWFYRLGQGALETPIPIRLSADTYLVFSGKRTTALGDGDLLFKAEGFEEVEATDEDLPGVYRYEADLNLHTEALNTVLDGLGATARTLPVAIDIENQNDDNTRRLTKQFDAQIRRQAYAGEDPPEDEEDPYPAPGNVLTKSGNLAGVTDADLALDNLGGTAAGKSIFKAASFSAVLDLLGFSAFFKTLVGAASASALRLLLGVSTGRSGWTVSGTTGVAMSLTSGEIRNVYTVSAPASSAGYTFTLVIPTPPEGSPTARTVHVRLVFEGPTDTVVVLRNLVLLSGDDIATFDPAHLEGASGSAHCTLIWDQTEAKWGILSAGWNLLTPAS